MRRLYSTGTEFSTRDVPRFESGLAAIEAV